MNRAPPIAGLLETALYVADMARSVAFFRDVLGLSIMLETPRLTAFDAGRGGVLLLFPEGGATDDVSGERGTVPGHDGHGPLHMAFAIAADALAPWRAHLAAAGVTLRGEMHWPRGGTSLYFEDPDGHVLEVATPGLWPNDADRA
ncbi:MULTISPECIES: VOC family protein [Sphingomonas]|uniref:VOC family protein n=1 Tax=Sphingomonas lycopersici TaxID=2951807 RepID=A0AA42CVJ5_9SPHN|nr:MULTISPECIES: VOC family protein [unclassified Sphingomonas]MCW6532309.1 VOC family protein [Sphingomonas lycopersici]MCW6536643.1 VOC family protein [Sphingomonas lycopersici]